MRPVLDAAHLQLGGPPSFWCGDILGPHVSRTMRELIAARCWLTVYRLPSYAPELSRVEGAQSHPMSSLTNLTEHSLDLRTALVRTRLKRLQ
ncbi:hypothetical protein [Streptomyces sp. RB17]|uniref:hypothetical protein n=1 Tax=Streptomyces sp. RB17 TaxID=2585197 RepID=UPI001E5AD146|nr:hypothetical protein [Streptomyces sp. RB17]